jgi:hypothetical protein
MADEKLAFVKVTSTAFAGVVPAGTTISGMANQIPDHVKTAADKVMAEQSSRSAAAIQIEKTQQIAKNFETSRTAELIQRTNQQDLARTSKIDQTPTKD